MFDLLTSHSAELSRVLVAEDDPTTRKIVSQVLAQEGIQVIEAPDGLSAINAIRNQDMDLVLLDINMPGMNGLQVCEAARETHGPSRLPIVMVTAEDGAEIADQCFNVGCNDYMRKPVNPTVLRHRVRSWLTRHHEQQNCQRMARFGNVALAMGRVGFAIYDKAEKSLRWDASFLASVGLSHVDLDDVTKLRNHVSASQYERLYSVLWSESESMEVRLDLTTPTGVHHWIASIMSDGQNPEQIILTVRDISDVERAHHEVERAKSYDSLTGLPLRHQFVQDVSQQLHRAKQDHPGGSALVAWINISRFGRFNTAVGEENANRLLHRAAERLAFPPGRATSFRAGRIAGDKFGICLSAAGAPEARDILMEVLQRFEYFFTQEGRRHFLALTCGYVFVDLRKKVDIELLIYHAQAAQRSARDMGLTVYEGRIEQDSGGMLLVGDTDMESCLQQALDEDQFFLVYQPQYSLQRRRVVACEALLRWNSPRLGVVMPSVFIPLLEDTGLIKDVGVWVIQAAFRQAAEWARSGTNVKISVNLAPQQLFDEGLINDISNAMRAVDGIPNWIEFEITESSMIQDVQKAKAIVKTLSDMGFSIAVDDFGVGYSSLGHILSFPIDTIKIDRIFVKDITSDIKGRVVVRSVVAMAQAMGISVTAEGIENQRQEDFVEALGVSKVQGFFTGKPMPPDELMRLVSIAA